MPAASGPAGGKHEVVSAWLTPSRRPRRGFVRMMLNRARGLIYDPGHGTRLHLACCAHADPMLGFLGFVVLLLYLILVVVPFFLHARFWPIALLLAIIGGLTLLH
jgi:hypothetical protein